MIIRLIKMRRVTSRVTRALQGDQGGKGDRRESYLEWANHQDFRKISCWLFQVLVCIFVFVVVFVIILIFSEVLTHTHRQVQLSIFCSHSDSSFMHGQPWKLCTELSERKSSPIYFWSIMINCEAGWQKLQDAAKGLRWKVWTRTKILSPIILYYVANCRVSWAIIALLHNT